METIYVTIRIDFESDGRMDTERTKEYAATMVTERAGGHSHTIEEGIQINNVEVCGINE